MLGIMLCSVKTAYWESLKSTYTHPSGMTYMSYEHAQMARAMVEKMYGCIFDLMCGWMDGLILGWMDE